MGRGVQRFTSLRAWQACDTYKKAVYRICRDSSIRDDWKLRGQLEESVAAPPAHVAEGFGRFNPPDFARYTVMARSSLMESQNHLLDAVDKEHITDETRLRLNALAEVAIEEVTGLMEYLQSPEALRNARRARERRIATRQPRRSGSSQANQRRERTPNGKRQTWNREHRTRNPELRTPNPEPNLNTNREERTKKRERFYLLAVGVIVVSRRSVPRM